MANGFGSSGALHGLHGIIFEKQHKKIAYLSLVQRLKLRGSTSSISQVALKGLTTIETTLAHKYLRFVRLKLKRTHTVVQRQQQNRFGGETCLISLRFESRPTPADLGHFWQKMEHFDPFEAPGTIWNSDIWSSKPARPANKEPCQSQPLTVPRGHGAPLANNSFYGQNAWHPSWLKQPELLLYLLSYLFILVVSREVLGPKQSAGTNRKDGLLQAIGAFAHS